MSLVPALSSDFDIGPYTFFCLELVPVLCKNIGIGPSVNFLLKKNTKLLVLVPTLCKNIGIGVTWHWSLHFFVWFFFCVPRGVKWLATWHSVSFMFIFNRMFAEGLIPIFLQSAGTNAKIWWKCRDQWHI